MFVAQLNAKNLHIKFEIHESVKRQKKYSVLYSGQILQYIGSFFAKLGAYGQLTMAMRCSEQAKSFHVNLELK